jgi:hypothetical protein
MSLPRTSFAVYRIMGFALIIPAAMLFWTATAGTQRLPTRRSAPAGGIKSSSTSSSVFTTNVQQALNPQLLLPDLVPHSTSVLSVCNWNESQGETCESQCPPIQMTLPIGTKNVSQRPLSGLVRIQVRTYPAGGVVKDWTVTDVPGQGIKTPGWVKKTIVRCHPPGQASVGGPPPNYSLVIQTSAAEASPNNNTITMYISPDSQIGP